MNRQQTIKHPAVVEGRGLFGGELCRMRFLPAEPDAGVVFVRRTGRKAVRIACDAAHLVDRDRRTALAGGGAVAETVEHVMSAVAGLGIDNLDIELDAEEAPAADGSAMPFVEALQQAEIVQQDSPRKVFVIDEPVVVSDGESSVAALPGPKDCLEIICELDYRAKAIGRQTYSFRLGADDYVREIAPARTFLLKDEAEAAREAGIGAHLTARDVLVFDGDNVVDNELRFADEPVRHKLSDLIGDLAAAGLALAGRIVACRGSHQLNHALARKLRDSADAAGIADSIAHKPVMDIQQVMRVLPHRYPFLMIDRVLEMDGNRRAVAVKNVTINEPFFQGHYPGQPIMPGVMTLEAMAQLSGLLLAGHLQRSGKVALLLSMNRVKMRRPVRPGDQLMLISEALHVGRRTGRCRCQAMVDGALAAEAEIRFMLVDPERV